MSPSLSRQLSPEEERIAALEAELKAWRKMIAQMDRLRLEQVARAEQAEATIGLLDSHTQFWMTALMTVRFYHELGDEFDCNAAMESLAEAAEVDE